MGHCSRSGHDPETTRGVGARGNSADRDNPRWGLWESLPPIAPRPSHFLRSLINYLQALLAGPLRRARRKGLMWRHDQRPTACASVRWPGCRRFRTDPALLRRARAGDGHAPEPARLAPLRRSPGRQGAAHQRAPGAARLQPARDQHDPSGPRPHRRAARRARRARRCAQSAPDTSRGVARLAPSHADVAASWRASPNSWARSTNRWRHLGLLSGLDATEAAASPGLRRPQSTFFAL